MIRRSRLAVLVGIAISASFASGCSQMPFHDDSYKTEIPAALEAADLGITDASAGIILDGFSETLVVGGTIESSVMSDGNVPPQFVQRIMTVALEGRSVDAAYFGLALSLSRSDFVDTDSAFTELGASPRSDGSITMEQAEQIAREGSE